MKKLLLALAVIASAGLASCISIHRNEPSDAQLVRISDTDTSRTISVGDFDAINTSRVDVVYSAGAPGRAVLTAPDNIIDYIKVEVSEGELSVYLSDEILVNGDLRATLTVSSKTVKEINATVSAVVSATTPLDVAGELELSASTAAGISLGEVRCADADIKATTSAKVKIANLECGDEADIDASTSSSVSVGNLSAMTLDARVMTAADITVGGGHTGSVDLYASTSGHITNKASHDGGRAKASTAGSIETDTARLTERDSTTGGSISAI